MQLLGRIAIILGAALLVVGIAIGLSHTSYLQNMTPTRAEFTPQSMTSATAGNTVVRTREFEREGHNAASLFGIVQVIQNLLIVGLIVLPFALALRFLPGRKSGGSGG